VPELHPEGIDAYRELLVGPYRIVFGLRGTAIQPYVCSEKHSIS